MLLFSDHPFGVAKTTGTPTTKANETAINANNAIWRIDVIYLTKNFLALQEKNLLGSSNEFFEFEKFN